MDKLQTIEDFYADKLDLMPDNLTKEIGHFNVLRIEDTLKQAVKPFPFNRKDYFKICLSIGESRVHYADKVISFKEQALVFTNPLIPYKWEPLSENQTGFTCIFSLSFFKDYGRIINYPIFQPGAVPIYPVTREEANKIAAIFLKMIAELNSDYPYKDDLLCNLAFELVHISLKMRPAESIPYGNSNAAARITSMFVDLLDRQFPIDDLSQRLQLRTASDYARQLSVHVNHLNKSIKEITQKTTSELINERLLQESKILLKHTNWNVSEIAYVLGFEEPTNFNQFFKKQLQLTPSQFRII